MGEFYDAYAVRKSIEVREECWGHLRQKPGTYTGYYEVTYSEFGDLTLHAIHFEGVEDNPWTFDRVCAHMDQHEFKEAGVYRFTGTINGDNELEGEWSQVYPVNDTD